MGNDGFPFVTVPDHLIPRVGNTDEGTRVYRAFGPPEAFEQWWEAVCEICKPENTVSPGGVPMFAQASRAAVHKRLKEGRLTAFCFHKETVHRTRFRKREVIVTEGTPITNIPVSECKAWGEQMRAMTRTERKEIQWGEGDNAGQVLIRKTTTRKKGKK